MMEMGALVWAKLGNYPPWPGMISEPPMKLLELMPVPKNKQCIYFFGTNNFNWVHIRKIKPYLSSKRDNFSSNKKKYKSKSKGLQRAIFEIENHIRKKNRSGNYDSDEDFYANEVVTSDNIENHSKSDSEEHDPNELMDVDASPLEATSASDIVSTQDVEPQTNVSLLAATAASDLVSTQDVAPQTNVTPLVVPAASDLVSTQDIVPQTSVTLVATASSDLVSTQDVAPQTNVTPQAIKAANVFVSTQGIGNETTYPLRKKLRLEKPNEEPLQAIISKPLPGRGGDTFRVLLTFNPDINNTMILENLNIGLLDIIKEAEIALKDMCHQNSSKDVAPQTNVTPLVVPAASDLVSTQDIVRQTSVTLAATTSSDLVSTQDVAPQTNATTQAVTAASDFVSGQGIEIETTTPLRKKLCVEKHNEDPPQASVSRPCLLPPTTSLLDITSNPDRNNVCDFENTMKGLLEVVRSDMADLADRGLADKNFNISKYLNFPIHVCKQGERGRTTESMSKVQKNKENNPKIFTVFDIKHPPSDFKIRAGGPGISSGLVKAMSTIMNYRIKKRNDKPPPSVVEDDSSDSSD